MPKEFLPSQERAIELWDQIQNMRSRGFQLRAFLVKNCQIDIGRNNMKF